MSTEHAQAPALKLGEDLTIGQAASVHGQLLEMLPALRLDPRLDLSAPAEFDSSAIQLLLALHTTLAATGQSLQVVHPSAAVKDALSVFGLLAHFGCAPEATAH